MLFCFNILAHFDVELIKKKLSTAFHKDVPGCGVNLGEKEQP